MSYTDRLKRLNAKYQKTKPAEAGGGFDLSPGTYQFVIKKGNIGLSKAPFAKGELEVKFYVQVLTGECKNKMGSITFFLEQPAKDDQPSQLARFKGMVEAMGISLPALTDKALAKAVKELIGGRIRGYSTGKGGNVYFNGPIDVEDEELDDSEFDEDEESDEDDDTEDGDAEEDEDEEEEAPPPKRKKASKAAVRKHKKSKTDDDDGFDLEDFDE